MFSAPATSWVSWDLFITLVFLPRLQWGGQKGWGPCVVEAPDHPGSQLLGVPGLGLALSGRRCKDIRTRAEWRPGRCSVPCPPGPPCSALSILPCILGDPWRVGSGLKRPPDPGDQTQQVVLGPRVDVSGMPLHSSSRAHHKDLCARQVRALCVFVAWELCVYACAVGVLVRGVWRVACGELKQAGSFAW